MIRTILRHLLTGKDGETHDIARYSWLWAVIVISAMIIHKEFWGTGVDVKDAAEALGASALAHGGALWAKKDTEPGG